jgi:uncharacterized protein (TIGR03083 family)
MKTPEPILVSHLFVDLNNALFDLLGSLDTEDWQRPIANSSWIVKDVALHLLGGDIGILSRKRDGFRPDGPPVNTWEELVNRINDLNDTWLRATKRISTRLLCDLLRFTGPQVSDYFMSLDPFALGDPVSWAGPDPAPVWLDLAREFTERWYHQQQIRDAVGRPGMKQPAYFSPVLDAFARALPHTYREVIAPEGTAVLLTLRGDSGGDWIVVRAGTRWQLYRSADSAPQAHVTLDQDAAWRLFTRGIDAKTAIRQARIEGDQALALPIFDLVSIIA